MEKKVLIKNKKLIFAGIAIFIFLILRFFLASLLPFILALITSFSLSPAANYLEKKTKIKNSIWAVLLPLLLLAGCLLLIILLVSAFWHMLPELCLDIARCKEAVFNTLISFLNRLDLAFSVKSGFCIQKIEAALQSIGSGFLPNVLPHFVNGSKGIIKVYLYVTGFLLIYLIATILWIREPIWRHDKNESPIQKGVVYAMGMLRIYIKAQLKIMSLILAVTFLAFLLTSIQESFLWAFLTAFLDMLPVFGTGLIYIPLFLYFLLTRKYTKAAILLAFYLLCVVIREYLEPKLIGKEVGISPIWMLMGFTLGIRLFGIFGFLLGPIYVMSLVWIWRYMKNLEK